MSKINGVAGMGLIFYDNHDLYKNQGDYRLLKTTAHLFSNMDNFLVENRSRYQNFYITLNLYSKIHFATS